MRRLFSFHTQVRFQNTKTPIYLTASFLLKFVLSNAKKEIHLLIYFDYTFFLQYFCIKIRIKQLYKTLNTRRSSVEKKSCKTNPVFYTQTNRLSLLISPFFTFHFSFTPPPLCLRSPFAAFALGSLFRLELERI